jgi:hypothetical protein
MTQSQRSFSTRISRLGWRIRGRTVHRGSCQFGFTGPESISSSALPARAPKLHALAVNPLVALTIDDHTGWPYRVLMVRGNAAVEMLDDVVPEYALSAERYFGPEQGPAWVSTLRGKSMARIVITPTWVGILDFETRFPSALTA